MARLAGAATKLTQTLEPSPILQLLLIRGRLLGMGEFTTTRPCCSARKEKGGGRG
jgi:hypothetical protein